MQRLTSNIPILPCFFRTFPIRIYQGQDQKQELNSAGYPNNVICLINKRFRLGTKAREEACANSML